MSVVPICCKVHYRDQLSPQKSNFRRSFSGIDSRRPKTVCSSSGNEKQIKSLSSYLDKLRDNKKALNSVDKLACSNKDLEISEDSFLDRVDQGVNEETKQFFRQKERRKPSKNNHSSHIGLPQGEEATDLYFTGLLASINIAVILFEIASPVKTSELEVSTIPLLYGAKVNQLIVLGEWWRLVTPMFLHSGIFHIGLSCWSLLTFGPKVCRGYGWFTFLLIYILGGFSANLISFLHTPDPTVGGTGPVYAIIGAWLIYQLQNKDVIPKDVSETLFQKAMIATGLCLILSHFCPIDEWAHFGAIFTGVGYGFFLGPTLEVDGGDEGITLVKRHSGPCKSFLFFGVFVLILSSLFLFIEPPLNDFGPESFF